MSVKSDLKKAFSLAPEYVEHTTLRRIALCIKPIWALPVVTILIIYALLDHIKIEVYLDDDFPSDFKNSCEAIKEYVNKTFCNAWKNGLSETQEDDG